MLAVLALLAAEVLADLLARPRRVDDVEPVAGRPVARLAGDDLDDVAAAQLRVQRHDAAVDLGAHGVAADVGVHGVGEVDRRAARGEALDVALGREHEDLVLEELDAQRVHELARVAGL